MSTIRGLGAALAAVAVLSALTGPAAAAHSPSAAASPPFAATSLAANEDVGLNPWWFDGLNIATAHKQTRGAGVKIAVIDSSINLDAADLRGADITLGPGRGPDGQSISYPDALYASHGTSVTTTIVGQGTGTDGPGIVGVAPEAEIIFYQKDPDPYDSETSGSTQHVYDAVADGVDIINMSFVDGDRLGYTHAVEAALDAGIVVVAGAGTPGQPGIGTPASIPGVIAVGALDSNAQAWTDQPGQEEGALIISAPGVDMPIGQMDGPLRGARWISGLEDTGTSLSTPIVSGMLALVKSKYPDATHNQLIQHLIHFVAGSEGDSTWGWRRDIGFGSASVTRMLEQDPTGWPDENPLMLDTIDDIVEAYPFTIYGQTDDTATNEPTPAANETAADSGDDIGLLPVVLIGAVVLLVVAAAAVLVIRRRSTSPLNDDSPLHQET